jgi:hypothetical protein
VRYEFRIMGFAFGSWGRFVDMSDQERSVIQRTGVIAAVISAPLCFTVVLVSRHFGLSDRLVGLSIMLLILLCLIGASFVVGLLWPELMKEAEESFEDRAAERIPSDYGLSLRLIGCSLLFVCLLVGVFAATIVRWFGF